MFRINITSNLASRGALALGGLLSVPLLLKAYGQEQYGLILVALTVIGYGAIFELGVGATIVRLLAETGNLIEERRRYFSASLAICFVTSIVVVSSLLTLEGFLTENLFKIQPVNSDDTLHSIFLISSVLISLQIFITLFSAALISKEYFVMANFASIAATLVVHVIAPVAALSGFTITEYFLVYSIGYLLQLLIIICCLWRFKILETIPIRFFYKDFCVVIKYSLKIFAATASGQLASSADRIIISSTLGPSALVPYHIAYSLSVRIWDVASSISSAYFPRMISTSHDRSMLNVILIRCSKIVFFGSLLAALVLVLLGYWFISVWTSPLIADQAYIILMVFAFTMSLTSLNWSSSNYLIAINRTGYVAKSMILAALINVFACYIMTMHYGLLGAVFAWSIGYIVVFLLINIKVFFCVRVSD